MTGWTYHRECLTFTGGLPCAACASVTPHHFILRRGPHERALCAPCAGHHPSLTLRADLRALTRPLHA